jgi:hypothetical protein
MQYQNLSAADFGVNVDSQGNLRGYAYGADIGWVNFETNGDPQVSLLTGNLSGYVWSANCGWISLSNAEAYVQTDILPPTITTGSLLPEAVANSGYNETLMPSGGHPDMWSVTSGSLPPGLGLSTGGVLSGTPTTPGTYTFTVRVTSNGESTTKSFTLIVTLPTTIDAGNRYAYGANFGWMDWRGNSNNGAVLGQYVCSGYIYSANAGWINLGGGLPANGIQYQNDSAADFGVNADSQGNLRGYAYGADIGWINFEETGAPQLSLRTGNLSGYVWSANCGWISLSNAVAYVQTDTLWPGPLDPDGSGLPTAWELTYFGTTGINANADPTGKGMTIWQDYLAGTNPNRATSILEITAANFSPGGTLASLTWDSVSSRLYYLQKTADLTTRVWTDSGLGLVSPSAGSTTTAAFTDTSAPARFYRVEAVLPLSP